MATYEELFAIFGNSELRNKVAVAASIVADDVINEDPGTPNHTNRLLFAKLVLQNPLSRAEALTIAVVAANDTLTTAQILGAADSAIKTNVAAVWDTFADGSTE